jgi:hypothetical protein
MEDFGINYFIIDNYLLITIQMVNYLTILLIFILDFVNNSNKVLLEQYYFNFNKIFIIMALKIQP